MPANLWPPDWGLWRKPPQRSYATLYKGRVYTLSTSWPAPDWPSLKSLLFEHDLILIIPKLSMWEMLHHAAQDPRCTALADSNADLMGYRIRGSDDARCVRWIIPAERWFPDPASGWGNDGAHVGAAQLRVLDDTSRHVGVGVHTTPSALGSALLYRRWRDLGLPRCYRPGGSVQDHFRYRGVGGRVDALVLGLVQPIAREIDLIAAYPRHYGAGLPWGVAVPIGAGHEPEWAATWFRQAWFTIPRRLALGPLPYRPERHLSWPLVPGRYGPTWLWKEQAQEAERMGITVEWGPGRGWREIRNHHAAWVDRVMELRATAPSENIRQIVKLAANAAIGRHAQGQLGYRIVRQDDPSFDPATDRLLESGRRDDIWPYALRADPDSGRESEMIHWYYYVIMQTSLSLYRMAAPIAEQERLLATSTDGLWTTAKPSLPNGWREKRVVTDWRCTAAGSYAWSGGSRQPGVAVSSRA